MDLFGLDVCDKAKNLKITCLDLNNCQVRKKIIPILPDGTYPDINQL